MEILIEYVLEYGLTAFLAIAGVTAFIKGKKYKIASEAIDVIDKILEAAKDGKITKAESQEIISEVKEVISAIKGKEDAE